MPATDEPAEAQVGREDDLDDENYQVREVYAQFGLTSYFAQVMEKGLVNALALRATATSPNPSVETFDIEFAKFTKMTFGWLVKLIESTFPDERELISSLNESLPVRNFVTHTFFWDRAADFMSFGGREAMLVELAEARERFKATDAGSDRLVERVAMEAGLSPDQYEKNYESAMDELRKTIPDD